jgi:hypothetical protein
MTILINCKKKIHYFRYEGSVTLEEIKKSIIDAHTNEPTDRILHDLRKANLNKLKKPDVIKLGHLVREINVNREPYKSAVVVSDSTTYGILRCALSYSNNFAIKCTRIYYDMDFAIDWLTGLRE